MTRITVVLDDEATGALERLKEHARRAALAAGRAFGEPSRNAIILAAIVDRAAELDAGKEDVP